MRKMIFLALILITTGLKVKAQEISYHPAFFSLKYYVDDTRVSKTTIANLMGQYENSNYYWNKYNNQKRSGLMFTVFEIGFITSAILSPGKDNKTVFYAGTIGSGICALIYFMSSKSNHQKSVSRYNEKVAGKSVDFSPSKQGLGLCLNF